MQNISSSRFVCGTSLHSVVIADAYGVPSRIFLPQGSTESRLKFHDYYTAYGTHSRGIADSLFEAELLGRAVTESQVNRVASATTEKLMNSISFMLRFLEADKSANIT